MYSLYLILIVAVVFVIKQVASLKALQPVPISVKDVEITPTANISADFNAGISIPISLNGGRAPHSLEVIDPNGVSIVSWTRGSSGSVCSGTNVMTCTVQLSSVDFSHDGTYTITAKNYAAGNVEKTATDYFKVTVFKDVTAAITPATNMEMTYKEEKTISCSVEGGLPPHQVDLTLPQLGTKSWTRGGINPSLTCSGKHTVTCQFSFTAEYSSDGEYVCKGYNVVRSTAKENEMKVELITVRATEVTIAESSTNVLTDGMLQINCTVLGKPLVDSGLVSWKHSNPNIDLSLNYSISEEEEFMLISTLLLDNPSVEHSGTYSCLADSTTGRSHEITIAEKEFLNEPVITLTPWDSVKKGAVVTVKCAVEGFPEKEASVTVQHYDTSKNDLKIMSPQSTTLKEKTFLFENTATCNDGFYVCYVKTTLSNGTVLETAIAKESPILEGCENMAAAIGGGVGGSVVFIIIIVLVVLFLFPRCRNAVKSKRTCNLNNGLQYPNAAFSPDCTDTQIGDDKAESTYQNRPSQPIPDEGNSSIPNLKPSAATSPEVSWYSNLDTMTNEQIAASLEASGYSDLDTVTNNQPSASPEAMYSDLETITYEQPSASPEAMYSDLETITYEQVGNSI